MRELEEARRLREAAEKRLAEYEAKLEKIDEDLERVRTRVPRARRAREGAHRRRGERASRAHEEGRRAPALAGGEADAARARRARSSAKPTRLATEILTKEMTLGDHDKFAETFLAELRVGIQGRGRPARSLPSAAAKGGLS